MGIVGAIEPADGHEVGELPDEEDGEESYGGPLDDAACSGSKPMRSWDCSGEGSDEGVERGDALEWRVDGYVADCGEQGQHAGDGIGRQR